MTGYANPSSLIDTAHLADHLTDASIAIVEVDEDTTAYDKGTSRVRSLSTGRTNCARSPSVISFPPPSWRRCSDRAGSAPSR
jgi:hypothetical protein